MFWIVAVKACAFKYISVLVVFSLQSMWEASMDLIELKHWIFLYLFPIEIRE